MNHKGQVLVIFVILLPLFLLLGVLTLDIGRVYYHKIRLNHVSKDVIREVIKSDNYLDLGRELFEKNGIDNTNLKIYRSDDQLILKNDYDLDSIFGKIIKIKSYPIKVQFKAYKEDGKLIIIKE